MKRGPRRTGRKSTGQLQLATVVRWSAGRPLLAMHPTVVCGELVALLMADPIFNNYAFGPLGGRASFEHLPFGIIAWNCVVGMLAIDNLKVISHMLLLEREVDHIRSTWVDNNVIGTRIVRARWFADTIGFEKVK